MRKIWLIIQREYLTRVKKRSFVVMTFLGPILMASVWIVPLLLASRTEGTKIVEVLDETGLFYEQFKETNEIKTTATSEILALTVFHICLVLQTREAQVFGSGGKDTHMRAPSSFGRVPRQVRRLSYR